MDPMKVTLVSPGRFHSFDLAEQLQSAHRLAAIYTGYPRFKLRDTRVDARLVRPVPLFQTAYLGLERIPHFPRRILSELAWRSAELIDAVAARTLPECAVVSALSSCGLQVGKTIQERGGAYVCDRGSSHIRWQERVIGSEYDKLGLRWKGIDPRIVRKEESEYAEADAITLPSSFALRTFVEMGVPASKLHTVPYGVNLDSFRRSADRASKFRVLFVGQLSVRKGLHYLLEAFRTAGLPDAELVLVGGRTPDSVPLLRRSSVQGLTWTGALPRPGVVREMSLASVMVLPSIEEGLALVQAQALACGCPVIATANAGAEDLFEDGKEGFIVPAWDADAIADRLTRLHRDRGLVEEMGRAGVRRVEALGGWDTYGRKMLTLFDELTARKMPAAAAAGAA